VRFARGSAATWVFPLGGAILHRAREVGLLPPATEISHGTFALCGLLVSDTNIAQQALVPCDGFKCRATWWAEPHAEQVKYIAITIARPPCRHFVVEGSILCHPIVCSCIRVLA
jgi:hypothetical protein